MYYYFFFLLFSIVFGQPPVLKHLYFQMAGNAGARNAQNHTKCVIAQFSNSNHSAHATYNFQGMDVDSGTIQSYQGEISPFTMSLEGMYCANMSKIDPLTGIRIPSIPHKSICAWKYDHVASEWILFTDRKKLLIFALVSNRSSISQQEEVDRHISRWEEDYNVTLFRTPFDQKHCKQFTPP